MRNVYLSLARRLGTQRWFAWFGPRVITRIDSRWGSRGTPLSTVGTGLPSGYLTTVGRRSGLPRSVPLLFVETATGAPAILGTNFGSEHDPLWVGNLLAEPRAQWRASAERDVVARRTTAAEYARLWPEFVAMWPGYVNYVERSGRRPAMFILEDPAS